MLSTFDLKAMKHDGISNHYGENTYFLLKVKFTSYDVEHSTKSLVTMVAAMFWKANDLR